MIQRWPRITYDVVEIEAEGSDERSVALRGRAKVGEGVVTGLLVIDEEPLGSLEANPEGVGEAMKADIRRQMLRQLS